MMEEGQILTKHLSPDFLGTKIIQVHVSLSYFNLLLLITGISLQ